MAYSKNKSPFTPISSDLQPFERARAKRIANDLMHILAGYLPADSCVWLSQHRPDVSRFLDEAL